MLNSKTTNSADVAQESSTDLEILLKESNSDIRALLIDGLKANSDLFKIEISDPAVDAFDPELILELARLIESEDPKLVSKVIEFFGVNAQTVLDSLEYWYEESDGALENAGISEIRKILSGSSYLAKKMLGADWSQVNDDTIKFFVRVSKLDPSDSMAMLYDLMRNDRCSMALALELISELKNHDEPETRQLLLTGDDITTRIPIAKWCIENNVDFAMAVKSLLEVISLDSSDLKIKLAVARLENSTWTQSADVALDAVENYKSADGWKIHSRALKALGFRERDDTRYKSPSAAVLSLCDDCDALKVFIDLANRCDSWFKPFALEPIACLMKYNPKAVEYLESSLENEDTVEQAALVLLDANRSIGKVARALLNIVDNPVGKSAADLFAGTGMYTEEAVSKCIGLLTPPGEINDQDEKDNRTGQAIFYLKALGERAINSIPALASLLDTANVTWLVVDCIEAIAPQDPSRLKKYLELLVKPSSDFPLDEQQIAELRTTLLDALELDEESSFRAAQWIVDRTIVSETQGISDDFQETAISALERMVEKFPNVRSFVEDRSRNESGRTQEMLKSILES